VVVTLRQVTDSTETRRRLGTTITKRTKITRNISFFFVNFVDFVRFVPEPSARLSQAFSRGITF
jgi:hypothetical protein